MSLSLLLDTSTFLWLGAGAQRLSSAASSALANAANGAYVSAVSAWEIGIKVAKGKLILPRVTEQWFSATASHHRLSILPIDASAAIASTELPAIHSDPFDRLLIATALERDFTLLTPDEVMSKYPLLKTLW